MKLGTKVKLFLCLSVLVLTNHSMAQFKKYKSPTNFQAPKSENKNTTSEIPVSEETVEDSSGEVDAFGRGTGIPKMKKGEEASKYVNLNPETAFGPEVVTSFDFNDADILDITKHMQKLTGINLILSKDVKGKISISAPTPITVGDAWKAYLTALNLNELSLVKNGAFYRIVKTQDIRHNNSKIYSGGFTPDVDNYVMKILPLRYISAKEIDRSFRPLMSRYGRLILIEQTNTIILHETGSNINRIVKLIEFLDVPGHDESLIVFPVKHSSAQEIAKILQDILQENKNPNRFRTANIRSRQNDISKIIAEPRTNSIIAMTNSDGAEELKNLINKLDVKLVASGSGKIHVHYLNYGDAKTVAATLNKIVSNNVDKSGNRVSKPAGTESGSLFGSEVKVEPDEDNNALVVTASPTDWLTVRTVISKLDIPRDQVYVEGLIMETSADKQNAFGISVLGGYGTGAAQRGGMGNPQGLLSLIGGQFSSVGGLFAGFGAGKKVELSLPDGNKVTVNNINGLITAIAEHTDSNVLATPQIMALDNTEATFEVGESIPIREQNTTSAQITTVTTSQQKAALKLKIKPHINKVTRFIRLEILQDITEFAESDPSNNGLGARTTNRLANTTVVVRDRDTVAMGGLMRDRTVFNVSKVPLLGDIPVLGWLFKTQTKRITKVNLLFFLTPKILASYQKTAAKNLKDLLNRRSVHLEKVQGADDPFASTMKGLYQKANKQDEGPLYDKDSSIEYIQNNEDEDGIGPQAGKSVEQVDLQTPDYQQIIDSLQKGQTTNANANANVNPNTNTNANGATTDTQGATAAVIATPVPTPVHAADVPTVSVESEQKVEADHIIESMIGNNPPPPSNE